MTRPASVSARDAERALRTAPSCGGGFAELFWERRETLVLTFDGGRAEDAITGVDQAAGIRVITAEHTTDEAARLLPDERQRPYPVARDRRGVPGWT